MKRNYTNPVVFKEQLSEKPIFSTTNIFNFYEYKIDYNDYLGEGVYGKVYGLIKRPDNEKGMMSSCMPYIYDYCFRADTKDKQTTPFCIKVSKSSFTILISDLYKGHPLPLARPVDSFSEKKLDIESTCLRSKYRISNIKASSFSHSFYAIAKIRVVGPTLEICIKQGYFQDTTQFMFRKAFANFIWQLCYVPLTHFDLHLNNVMFDQSTNRLEIIDSETHESDRISNIINPTRSTLYPYDYSDKSLVHEKIMALIITSVKDNLRYTKELDAKILKRAIKKTKPAFPATTDDIGRNYEFFGGFRLPYKKAQLNKRLLPGIIDTSQLSYNTNNEMTVSRYDQQEEAVDRKVLKYY